MRLGETAYDAWVVESIRLGFLKYKTPWSDLTPVIQDLWDHIANVVAARVKEAS